MYNKRFFSIICLVMLSGNDSDSLRAGGNPAPEQPEAPAAKELTVAGVVFQDDQFMKSMVQGYTMPAPSMASRS